MTRTSLSRAPPGNGRGREADEAIRRIDWQATETGPRAAWSECLRSGVELLLEASEPMALVWGPRQTIIVNDAWIAEVGSADALGLDASAATDFPWPALGEDLQRAMSEGAARTAGTSGLSAFRLLPLFDERGATAGLVIRALPVPGAQRDWLPFILEHGEVGVLDWDPVADILSWSRDMDAILGAPEIEPRPRLEHFVARALPEDRDKLLAAFAAARDALHPLEQSVRVVAPEGSIRRWELRMCALRDTDRERARVIGVVRNETEPEDLGRKLRAVRGELQHRVRNILAVTRSLMRRTARTADTIDDFVSHFDGRLGALARLQTMLLRDPETGVDFEMLLREELLSVAAEDERISLSGPGVEVPYQVAQTVSLMLHELVTNALKFGALSEPDARLDVTWQGHGDCLQMTWRELGVPLVVAPSRKGAGLEMLERVLPYETGGRADYDFEPSGFVCSVRLPLPTRPATS